MYQVKQGVNLRYFHKYIRTSIYLFLESLCFPCSLRESGQLGCTSLTNHSLKTRPSSLMVNLDNPEAENKEIKTGNLAGLIGA